MKKEALPANAAFASTAEFVFFQQYHFIDHNVLTKCNDEKNILCWKTNYLRGECAAQGDFSRLWTDFEVVFFFFESYLNWKSDEVRNNELSLGEFLKNPEMFKKMVSAWTSIKIIIDKLLFLKQEEAWVFKTVRRIFDFFLFRFQDMALNKHFKFAKLSDF